jgi:CRP-like cAMP-binding protein
MIKTSCDLQTCFLCRNTRPEWRELTALRKESSRLRKGEMLIREGEAVSGIYMILEGAVKVHRRWGAERELIVRFAGKADVVGFRGIGAGNVYPVSATALEQVTACFIPLEFLETSLDANPQLSRALMQLYAAELQLAEQRMSDLAHMDVKGRLVRTLINLKTGLGLDAEGFIRLPVSRQDIASYSGTIYETVFKIFSEWTRQGWIATEGKRIRMLEEAKLGELIREPGLKNQD